MAGADGQVIRQNLITYIPTKPYELTPGIFWVTDTNELIITLPVGTEYDMDGPETRSTWRYAIDGDAEVQVSLDPPVIGSDYSISPDGNWILYNYYYYPGKTDEAVAAGLYLGNLREGNSQLLSAGVSTSTWSLDGLHFTYEGEGQGLFLGMTNGQRIPIDNEGRILGWADSNHFLYFHTDDGTIMMGGTDGKITNIPYSIPAPSVRNGPAAFSFVFLNP